MNKPERGNECMKAQCSPVFGGAGRLKGDAWQGNQARTRGVFFSRHFDLEPYWRFPPLFALLSPST